MQEDLSDFNDVSSREARDWNRGAVLANMYEQYTTDGVMKGAVFKRWLSALTDYLNRIPPDEHETAKLAMGVHLRKRGYVS